MDRADLHTLIDAALDSIGCEECRELFVDLIGVYVINDAGMHNAKDLGDKVRAGELSPAAAYDMLSAAMRPVYAAAGDDVSDERNTQIRDAFLRVANRDLN